MSAVVVFFAAVAGWWLGGQQKSVQNQTSGWVKSAKSESVYVYFVVEDQSRLKLIPNYESKLPSLKLVSENECLFGINGGFYATNGKPIGLVVIDGSVINPVKTSQLFNGFVWVRGGGSFGVGRNLPVKINYGVQTGPMLVESGRALNLEIKNDSSARRSVVIEVTNGRMVFVMIYDEKSRLDGPTLAELPGEVMRIAGLEGWKVVSAINLDGGAASAFYSSEVTVSEWLPVGSWWCVVSLES